MKRFQPEKPGRAESRPLCGQSVFRRHGPWVAGALLLAAFLWPLWGAQNPRLQAAQKALSAEGDPTRRTILEFQRAYASTPGGRPADSAELKRLWATMESFKAPHPGFFWMALCLLEARSGNLSAARKALEKARALDPKAVFLARGGAWGQWRETLGLSGP